MQKLICIIIGIAMSVAAIGGNLSFDPFYSAADSNKQKKTRFKTQKFEEDKKVSVSFGGYARVYAHHRNMQNFAVFDSFINQFIAPRKLSIGDGYREPILMLNTTITAKGGMSLATDFFLFTPFGGTLDGNFFANNIMLNLYGTIPTKFGTFSVKTGGIHWYNISDFTMGSIDLNRFSVFMRTPWEDAGASQEKYQRFYEQGQIQLDQRFTSQAFKGIMLEGFDLPKGFSFNLLYGKNATNVNDVATLPEELPHYTLAGKIENTIKEKNRVGFNTINSIALNRPSNAEKAGFNMMTLTHSWYLKKMHVSGEAGIGSFFSPTYERQWDPGVKIKFSLPKEYTFLPMDFEFFYIGRNFVNNIGSFLNTSVQQLLFLGQSENSQSTVLQPFASPILNIEQMSNNRWGIHYNVEADIKGLKLNLGYGLASELNWISNQISVGHRVNGLTLSRIYFFQVEQGPYDRLGTFFRGAYNVVDLANPDTTVNKKFNTLELQAKYDLKIGKRHIYFFYFGSLNSVQDHFSAGPKFSDDAWVRAYYNEFDVYIQVFPKVFLGGYFGFEQIKSNMETVLSTETGLPQDQFGRMIGVGLDIDISKKTGLYLRQRWFHHEDRNFPNDKLYGTETEIEFKVFF